MASYPQWGRPSKPSVFLGLMTVSLGLLLLPRDILGPARNMAQLIAVPQWLASEATRGVTGPLRSMGTPAITAEQHSDLLAQMGAMRDANASLSIQVAELNAKIRELTQIREQGFPQDGRLIPATVIAADAVASRGSLLLSRGSLHKVKTGDWVTSRLFVDGGTDDGIRKGAGVLARETLIGWVEETEALTSRVVLLSDNLAGRATLVHVVRYDSAKGRPLVVSLDGKPASFALQGAGRGLMKISDIDARWVEGQFIKLGDLITSDPNDLRLPVAMVIGEISALTKVRDDKKKPLYYTAEIKHRYDPRLLSQVFVADFAREAGKRAAGRQGP